MRKNLTAILFLFVLGIGGLTAANDKTAESHATEFQVNSFRVNGNVRDFQAGEALAGVSVSINGQKVFTDFDGNFSADRVTGSTCEIKVALISYEPQVIVLPAKDVKDIKVSLRH